MKFVLILSIVLSSCQAFAQDWNFFPTGNKGVYEIVIPGEPVLIDVYQADSLRYDSTGAAQFFNASYDLQEPCFSYMDMIMRSNSWFRIDSLYLENGTTQYSKSCCGGIAKFIFLNNSQPGDSWNLPDAPYTFNCDSAGVIDILGEPDSVKYYSVKTSPVDTCLFSRPFVLSKHFGLIEFVPIIQIYIAYPCEWGRARLLGFSNDTVSRGMNLPETTDYFQLQAGDVLYWKEEFLPYDITDTAETYFIRDSLTSVLYDSDTIRYFVHSDKSDGTSEDIIRVYPVREYSLLTELPTYWGAFVNIMPHQATVPAAQDEVLLWESEFIFRDSIDPQVLSRRFFWNWYTLDTITCEPAPNVTNGYTFQMNTREGLVFLSDYNDVREMRWTIIGSRIDGVLNGQVWNPSGKGETEADRFRVFPNPTSDYIWISGIENATYSLSDLSGKVVLQGSLSGQEISLSGLPAGMYLVRLISDKVTFNKLVIKKD
jgi:hypothetical protein